MKFSCLGRDSTEREIEEIRNVLPGNDWKFTLHLMCLLSEFFDLCRQKGWRPIIDFGTLLGAIRTGNVIAYDYDADIEMFEDDYRAMVAAFQEAPNHVLGDILYDPVTEFARGDWATCRLYRNSEMCPIELAPLRFFRIGLDIAAIKEYENEDDPKEEKGRKMVGTCMRFDVYDQWRGVYKHPAEMCIPLRHHLFMGEPALTYAQPFEILKRNYGDGWRKPDQPADKVRKYGMLMHPPIVTDWKPDGKTVCLYDPSRAQSGKHPQSYKLQTVLEPSESQYRVAWLMKAAIAGACGLNEESEFENVSSLGELVKKTAFKCWGRVFAVVVPPGASLWVSRQQWWVHLVAATASEPVEAQYTNKSPH
jgi:hypothetical protein